MNGKMANIFESDVKCEFHSNTLQLFSNINNRTILRGRCLEHIGNACVAYSGIDKLNGQLLYITEWKIQYNKLSTKCSILCKNGCVDHTPQNIIAGIEDQLKLLYQIDHENLIRYETVIWSENENFFSIYLVRNLVRGSTLRSLTKSIGWTSSGIRKIISALFDVIAHLHKNVVAHGNINDLSIFIDESGICKVTDYCLIPYLNYLTRESQVHYLSMKEDDLTAMGDLIASFAISSEQITDLIKKCKLNQDLTALMGHPFLLNISITRFEVDFTVLKHLGAGGFGDVLHVKNYHDEKEYAIKRIRLPKNDTIANDSSRLEVRHLSMLEHVNIVRYFASWSEYLDEAVFNKYLSDDDFYDDDSMSVDSESDDETEASSRTDLWVQPKNKKFKCDQLPKVHVMYILMELCDERNLRKVIDNSGLHNDAERIHKYFMEIAAGLKYIHSQDIIHSDLKPDNIFLSQSGHIKIGDFGLATTISLTLKQYREKNSKDSDEEVETLGTPLYISPEVIRTSIPNPKMDMYSFGVILFEMCHPPFSTGMQRIKTLDGIRRAEIAIPPYMKHNTVFFSYERIVKDLLNHDMRRRPTAKQLLRPFGNYKRDLTFNSQPI